MAYAQGIPNGVQYYIDENGYTTLGPPPNQYAVNGGQAQPQQAAAPAVRQPQPFAGQQGLNDALAQIVARMQSQGRNLTGFQERMPRGPIEDFQFRAGDYMAMNPDVAAAVQRGEFATPWEHYNRFGRAEGRSGTSMVPSGANMYRNPPPQAPNFGMAPWMPRGGGGGLLNQQPPMQRPMQGQMPPGGPRGPMRGPGPGGLSAADLEAMRIMGGAPR